MKRKIAAIMAADIAGYAKLVAEDEEETLRRLEAYREVFQDFVARASGRIFNTAGDAVMAEFASAVDAVRCAIDLQESLRARNLGYPASRQMSFRIGISIGDVVERDGDLLGDGVNVAARLQGLADPGGLCVSRTVYEQVGSKLTVKFIDIGEQQVKNLPLPIHAYVVALGATDRLPASAKSPKRVASLWPVAVTAASLAAIAAVVFLYHPDDQRLGLIGPPTPPDVAGTEPSKGAPALIAEQVPYISDRERILIRDTYMPAPDHKALAISAYEAGYSVGQKDDEAARAAALEQCRQLTDTISAGTRCSIYAVGNTVIAPNAHPAMPRQPWLVRDPSIETPFDPDRVPLANDRFLMRLQKGYRTARKIKVAALSTFGRGAVYAAQATVDEAVRRALELCGSRSRFPCIVLTIDDNFVVPIPTTRKVTGLFYPSASSAIAANAREDVERRLQSSTGGWNAIAVGAARRPGMMLKAASEQQAIDGALAECAQQDRDCHVIALGPFAVEAK
jgi:class 3 adenylate cyclase